MAALNAGARRLERRARAAETRRAPARSTSPPPSQALQQAKWALRDAEHRVGRELDALWLPIRIGMRTRPGQTLALSAAVGCVIGWADARSHGALSRRIRRMWQANTSS